MTAREQVTGCASCPSMQNNSFPAVAVGLHQPECGDEIVWTVFIWSVEVSSIKN